MPTVTTDAESTLADAVVERLDLMLAVLQLAHHDAIARAAVDLRTDDIVDAILEACGEDWVPVAELKTRVKARVPAASETVITRRLGMLVARRAIQRRGATHTVAYRALGLV